MVSPIKTFICYAHEDRTTVEAVIKHLRVLERKNILEIWNDGQILAGQDWDKSIKIRLETAQLILLFVSVDFIDSDYIEKTELKTALARHQKGEVTLIPIVVRDCEWEDYFDIGRFQALPKGGKPIISSDRNPIFVDEVYKEITSGIKVAIQHLLEKVDKPIEYTQPIATKTTNIEPIQSKETSRNNQEEAAWAGTMLVVGKAKTEQDKVFALNNFLNNTQYLKYRKEAEKELELLHAILYSQELAIKIEKEAQKKAADHAKAHSNGAISRPFPQAPEMVYVEGGIFSFSDTNVQVTLDAYRIGKYQVTFEEYDFFCDETKREKPNDAGWGRGRRPVINVNWQDCVDYCEWISARTGSHFHLPTECQWEFAAKGGTISKGFEYAGGNKMEEVGWYWENSGDKILTGDWDYDKIKLNNCKTHLVGENKSNELGLYDMSGNVWEWCADFYESDFYEKYIKTGVKNPIGPLGGTVRVLRGGSWSSNYYIRVASRNDYVPTNRSGNVGFRLAQD
jgi:formylglycine-generating enzyme required for sulfatase activity